MDRWLDKNWAWDASGSVKGLVDLGAGRLSRDDMVLIKR